MFLATGIAPAQRRVAQIGGKLDCRSEAREASKACSSGPGQARGDFTTETRRHREDRRRENQCCGNFAPAKRDQNSRNVSSRQTMRGKRGFECFPSPLACPELCRRAPSIPPRNRGVYFGHGIYPERSRRVPVDEINATFAFFGLRSLGGVGSVSRCLRGRHSRCLAGRVPITAACSERRVDDGGREAVLVRSVFDP